MEARSTKHEITNKQQVLNSKLETRVETMVLCLGFLGFRFPDLFRVSDLFFGAYNQRLSRC